MVGALGVNQALLFTAVFALGSFLAGLGGALQLAREPASLAMDLSVIGDAFVVVVVGGMGSIPGAYLAAVLIAEIKALCISIGVVHIAGFDINFSKLTLVAEFLVMAVVLIVRPARSAGRPQPIAARLPRDRRSAAAGVAARSRRRPRCRAGRSCACARWRAIAFALHAGARHRRADRGALCRQPAFHHGAGRHAFVRPRGLFRARRLRRGADGEIARRRRCLPRSLQRRSSPALGALLFGWFAVRLSGVYLAMLTLAFAQIVWSIVFQWEDVTGGSNGVLGVWPTPPFDVASALLSPVRSPRPRSWSGAAASSCSRRSAMRCGRGATRRCAPRPSAST